jgi:predicted nuclease with TOPRIM domain
MAKDDSIGFRIDSATKQRWQDAAEKNPEYRSLTHMICVAVENELAEGDAGIKEEVEVDLSRLHDRFDTVQRRIEYIEDRLDDTFVAVRGEQDAEVMDIAGKVLDYVPEPDDPQYLVKADPEAFEDPEDRALRTGKVSAIVELLCSTGEYDEFEVKQAIERVEQEMETVQTMDASPQDSTTDKRIYRLPE